MSDVRKLENIEDMLDCEQHGWFDAALFMCPKCYVEYVTKNREMFKEWRKNASKASN